MQTGREPRPHRILYSVLGVETAATPGQIAAAYRRLAKSAHPDMDGGDAALFRRIEAAYAVLSDPAARARYDRTGFAEPAPACERMAGEAMARAIADALDRHGVKADLVLLARRRMHEVIRDAQAAATAAARRRQALHEAIGRLSMVDGGPSAALDLLRERIVVLDAELVSIAQAIAVGQRTVELLQLHRYRAEPSSELRSAGRVVWGNPAGGSGPPGP
jgi:hypothetical protein